MTKEESYEKATRLDNEIYVAIRKAYGYTEEAERLVKHFSFTAIDADSFYGLHGLNREDEMYGEDFDYRNED